MKYALRNQPFLTYEADIYYHLGISYCRLEKFEKSIFPFTKCIEKMPSDLRYLHERAKAYQMIGEHEIAIKDFDIVIKKDPRNANAYFRRAFSLKALGTQVKDGSTGEQRAISKQKRAEVSSHRDSRVSLNNICLSFIVLSNGRGGFRKSQAARPDERKTSCQLQNAQKRRMHRPLRTR